MNSFFSHRAKRLTARVVLLCWLFAVAAGVANACLLETHRAHDRAVAAGAAPHDASAASAGQAVALATQGDHDDPSGSKAPCLKVCDETTQSLVKQPASWDFDAPALAAALWSPWSTWAWLEHIDAHSADMVRLPPPGPVPRVKYSRLAL